MAATKTHGAATGGKEDTKGSQREAEGASYEGEYSAPYVQMVYLPFSWNKNTVDPSLAADLESLPNLRPPACELARGRVLMNRWVLRSLLGRSGPRKKEEMGWNRLLQPANLIGHLSSCLGLLALWLLLNGCE